jgi:hypothetical protein
MTFHQTIVIAWMQMAELSSKNAEYINSVTACAIQTRALFCEFFHSPTGSVPCQEEATGDV